MKIGVLLAGCGVYDGSEIHEATSVLLAIDQLGSQAICFAPDIEQYHVINHLNGQAANEKRNVLTESARIARGDIQDIAQVTVNDFDALVIPGGFGAAKNLNQWAIEGPDGSIVESVKNLIIETVKAKKPLAALCMGPTVVAKALEQTGMTPSLTVGTTADDSPYDIEGITKGIESLGMQTAMKSKTEVNVDEEYKIISAPCYMMEASISEVYENAKSAIEKLITI